MIKWKANIIWNNVGGLIDDFMCTQTDTVYLPTHIEELIKL